MLRIAPDLNHHNAHDRLPPSDAVQLLGVLREERGLLVPAESRDDFLVGVHDFVVRAPYPVHRPVGGEETAVHSDGLDGCEDVPPDAVCRPVIVAHAEAGDLPADVVASGRDGHAILPLLFAQTPVEVAHSRVRS